VCVCVCVCVCVKRRRAHEGVQNFNVEIFTGKIVCVRMCVRERKKNSACTRENFVFKSRFLLIC